MFGVSGRLFPLQTNFHMPVQHQAIFLLNYRSILLKKMRTIRQTHHLYSYELLDIKACQRGNILDGRILQALQNGRIRAEINSLNFSIVARLICLEIALMPSRKSPTIRFLPFSGFLISFASSFCSPESTHKIYAKAIAIRRVSILFGSVTLVFSSSNALVFQSLCIGSMPNRNPYTLSALCGRSEERRIGKEC